MAEKAFLKIRDRYVRAKRELKKKSTSGTSSAAVCKLKEKLDSLKYLAWLDIYAKPRASKSNLDDVMSDEESIGESIDDLVRENFTDAMSDEEMSPPITTGGNVKEKTPLKRSIDKKDIKQQKKPKKNKTSSSETQESIDDEELNILRSVRQSMENSKKTESKNQEDKFKIFGDYVASKLRRLSTVLDEDQLEAVEFEITTVFEKARRGRQHQKSSLAQNSQYNLPYNYGLSNISHYGISQANSLGSPQFNPPNYGREESDYNDTH